MTGILKDFSFAIAYLDDIIIFSRTAEEHLNHIKQEHISAKNIQISMYIPWTHGILQKIHQELCKNGQTFDTVNLSASKI